MIWQYILTALSCAMFFGFVVLCVRKFGLLSCYSAYGPLWAQVTPSAGMLNIWSAVTLVTAFMLVPVLLENSEHSPWQFTGFLCPALILFVAATPDYATNKLAGTVHLVCALAGAILSIAYILLVTPRLWWVILVYVLIATACTVIYGKWSWDFWFEMAAFAGIYTTAFLII